MTPLKINVTLDPKGNAAIEIDEAALGRIPLRSLMADVSGSYEERDPRPPLADSPIVLSGQDSSKTK